MRDFVFMAQVIAVLFKRNKRDFLIHFNCSGRTIANNNNMNIFLIFAIGLLAIETANGIKCFTCKEESFEKCLDTEVPECVGEGQFIGCYAFELSKAF